MKQPPDASASAAGLYFLIQPFDPFLVEDDERLISMLANECTFHRAYDVGG